MKQPIRQNVDLLKLIQPELDKFEVISQPLNMIHRVTINDDFVDVQQFAQLVDILDSANEGDCVQIRLSTDGGALHAIIPLINAMQNTDAYVHVHVESDTASAGTVIMMLADSCYVNPYSTVMLHTASYGFYGHSGNMDAHVTHSTKAIEKFVRDIYTDFVTEAEMLRLLDGKELYFDSDECHRRFDAREDKRAAAELPENVFKEQPVAETPQPVAKPKRTPKSKEA
jgi:ATP-dependent protease ClpP protease subunit